MVPRDICWYLYLEMPRYQKNAPLFPAPFGRVFTFDRAFYAYESFDIAVAIAGIELVDVCKPACTSSGQCWKRVDSVKEATPLFNLLFQFPIAVSSTTNAHRRQMEKPQAIGLKRPAGS